MKIKVLFLLLTIVSTKEFDDDCAMKALKALCSKYFATKMTTCLRHQEAAYHQAKDSVHFDGLHEGKT